MIYIIRHDILRNRVLLFRMWELIETAPSSEFFHIYITLYIKFVIMVIYKYYQSNKYFEQKLKK